MLKVFQKCHRIGGKSSGPINTAHLILDCWMELLGALIPLRQYASFHARHHLLVCHQLSLSILMSFSIYTLNKMLIYVFQNGDLLGIFNSLCLQSYLTVILSALTKTSLRLSSPDTPFRQSDSGQWASIENTSSCLGSPV